MVMGFISRSKILSMGVAYDIVGGLVICSTKE